jgi:periplasmic protein TonB
MSITRLPASPSARGRMFVSEPGRRRWRWTVWAAASLAVHAAVVAWIFVQASPLMASDPGSVVTVELVPMAPARSGPKTGSTPAPKTQARHVSSQKVSHAPAHKQQAQSVLAEAGRHALPAPARPRQVEPSRKAAAPDHPSTPTAAALAAMSRKNLDLVRRHLERFKFYPESARRRGIGGNVDVGFRLTAGGHVAQVRITASSGYALLDEAAEAIVARAVPFPVDTGQYRVRLRFWP